MSFVGRGSRLLSAIQCKKIGWAGFFLLFFASGCAERDQEEPFQVFSRLTTESTGITFENRIVEHEGFNVLEYEYFFNGGGVAIGDLNNDGLPDIYFTANMEPDQLYLNKGELKFENITVSANLDDTPHWTTGVTMADVNADGWLDIYVCQSGQVSEERRRNLLYINNGDLTFSEQAAAFGLDDPSYSNHASFFDYDRDGDLDMYLLNHPIRRFSNFDVALMKQQRDPLAGDKLYRNDNGSFVDVSVEAGIIGNPLGFGLSAVVSDINLDGWPDLYVANDYIEEDYLYINQQNGTFVNEIANRLTHASYSSMGTDIADINNDGLPDVLTLDMMAEDHYRQKILKGPENYVFYDQMRERGIHEQYMRNMLQLNNGNGTFSEIGQLAGVSNTDWSWAVLLADFNNNGFKDVVITNGYLRDYTDLDYLERVLGEARRASAMGERFSSLDLVQKMPSTRLKNYAFMNEGGLVFSNQQQAWDFDTPSFSNGAAYGDLDLDGDLDLVINNINDEAFVFRNNSQSRANANFLRIVLEGPDGNPLGIGSAIKVKGEGGKEFLHYVSPARGYLSSVEPIATIGLESLVSVDLHVTWPDGREEIRRDLAANQTVSIAYGDSRPAAVQQAKEEAHLVYALGNNLGLGFVHEENRFYDFGREALLPHMLSRMGPALAIEDVNRDNLEDIFVGGARGQSAVLYLQQPNGTFKGAMMPDLDNHAFYEDIDAVFFDADNDGDPDLFIASGGNDEVEAPSLYQDRLYLNNGFGTFSYAPGQLPVMESSTATASAHDFDLDGDLDLFVGGFSLPGQYPQAPRSYLLENNEGVFVDVTEAKAALLTSPGMITDAEWSDLDGDGVSELLLSGEWMSLRVFSYVSGGFEERTDTFGLGETQGWWNTITVEDLDDDGDLDIIAGNQGLNTQLKASSHEPLRVYAQDFDANGIHDLLIRNHADSSRHTIYWREELVNQIPAWNKVLTDNKTYAGMRFSEIEKLIPPDALILEAQQLATQIFENKGDGTFSAKSLPIEAQFGPVNSILVRDLNEDGNADILFAGNDFTTRPQLGPSNGGRGTVLLGKEGLEYTSVSPAKSGFYAPGDVRRMDTIQTANGPLLVVVSNNGPLQLFSFDAR